MQVNRLKKILMKSNHLFDYIIFNVFIFNYVFIFMVMLLKKKLLKFANVKIFTDSTIVLQHIFMSDHGANHHRH